MLHKSVLGLGKKNQIRPNPDMYNWQKYLNVVYASYFNEPTFDISRGVETTWTDSIQALVTPETYKNSFFLLFYSDFTIQGVAFGAVLITSCTL